MTDEHEGTVEDAVRAAMAAFEQREAAAAAEAGVSLEEYRRRTEAAEAEAERRERAAAARRLAEDALEPLAGRIRPQMYAAILLGHPLKQTRALSAVRGWLRDRDAPAYLILSGNTRVGKTVACAWALSRHTSGEYCHAQEMAERVAPWRDELARGVKAAKLGAELLVLDDLGTETVTDRSAESLYRLLDGRQGFVKRRGRFARARTIITTNLSRNDLLEHVDARVARRLLESGMWLSAGLEPADRRSA